MNTTLNLLLIAVALAAGGATFVDVGDATDAKFTSPKVSYGVGVRVGLPPDWISRARVDLGFGNDQRGVFADFGHSF